MLEVWTLSSWDRCFPQEGPPENPEHSLELHLARNEAESGQILLRADQGYQVRRMWAEGLESLEVSLRPVQTIAFQDGVPYPDPLSNQTEWEGEAGVSQGVWVTVRAASAAKPGSFQGAVHLETTLGEAVVPVKARVYNVTVPSGKDAAFSLEYWVNAAGFWWRNPHLETKDFLAEQYGCEKYGERWWRLMESIAAHLRDNRINVLFVRTHDLLRDGGTNLTPEGRYQFCWDLFDRFVSFFLQRAEIKRLAGFHLVKQTEGEEAYVLQPDGKGGLCVRNVPLQSREAEQWFEQFLPALYAHLQEKGWLSYWIQHIEDEPAAPDSWLQVRRLAAQYLPGVPCFDALDNQAPAPALQGAMDIWLPRIDIFEENQDFYAFRAMQGETRWTYTCCVPNTPNYFSKFIDSPYWKNRLLFWACFLRGFTGFLHWGYNYWDTSDIYFGFTPKAYFKGDGYIVYPDPEHDAVRTSIRMENTRDAAEDYELLALLAKADPEKAYQLARRVANSFHDFTWDTGKMKAARLELLQAVESACASSQAGSL